MPLLGGLKIDITILPPIGTPRVADFVMAVAKVDTSDLYSVPSTENKRGGVVEGCV